jgi:hypothetical protein
MDNGASDSNAGSPELDLEHNEASHFLMNGSVSRFSWSGLNVTVKDRQTKRPRDLIHDISGDVRQGMCIRFKFYLFDWCDANILLR